MDWTSPPFGDDWFTFAAFVSIPVVASIIGYGTNVLAIQMTFLPLEYIGFYEPAFRKCGFSLGWQGIIPANAAKIAQKQVTIMTTRLIKVEEIFARLDAKHVSQIMREPLFKSLERVLESVAVAHAHDFWQSLPLFAREELVHKAVDLSEPATMAIFEDLRVQVHDVLDLHALAIEKLLEDKEMMNEVFKRCGEPEFRFIERSGFYFGFLIGVVQAVVWWYLLALREAAAGADPRLLAMVDTCVLWFLPVAGMLNGWITNALALGVIFNPIEPLYCCCGGVRLQGLFLQRQEEVSEAFAEIVSSRIVTAAHCWENILFGKGQAKLKEIVSRHVARSIDAQVGVLRPLVPFVIGSDNFQAAKEQASELMYAELPSCIRATYEYTERAMDIEATLIAAMKVLPAREFERVLHPAFEEDEWKLIGVGGLLGLLVGIFQLTFVFSETVR